MTRFYDYGSGGQVPPPHPEGGLPQNQQHEFQSPYLPPPPAEEMGTGKIVGLSALACCIPLIGPLISLIIGIMERAKKNALVVIVISAVMLVLSIPLMGIYAAVALPLIIAAAPEEVQQDFDEALGGSYGELRIKAKEAEVKHNLHQIMIAIERFTIENDNMYPDSIEQVIQGGFIEVLPTNPFSLTPMVTVDIADSAETREGNFSYIRNLTDDSITGYTLLGFGSIHTTESRFTGGNGPAAVVISLDSGIDSQLQYESEFGF